MNNIIKVIVLGVLFFVMGGILGILYQQKMEDSQLVSKIETLDIIKALNSKIIPMSAVPGRVTKIDGKNIVLSSQAGSAVVYVGDDAKIFTFISDQKSESGDKTYNTKKELSFSDIKIGDSLNVSISVLPDGKMEGVSIFIVPPIFVLPTSLENGMPQ